LPGIIGLGSKNNFLSNILSNIKNNNQLIISNIKFKFNNVIHVNNVAEIISSMLQKNFFNYLYNLGVKYPIQIINIIKIMMKFLKKDSKVNVLHKKNQPFRISLNKQLVKNFKIYSLRKSLMLFLKENSN
jgi:dTDP-D-glucose 4,6-dehydratase